jgi:hypothetical protein
VEVHRFGRDGELARADHVHDAVALDVDVADAAGVVHLARVEVGGRTSAMSAGGYASLTLLKRPKPEKTDDWGKAEHDRLTLRAFVDHVVLSASGVGAGRAHDAIVVLSTPDKPDSKRTSFAPLARDRAAAWLRSVVRDLLTGPHAYFFPCESALAWQRSAARGDLVDWIAKARNFLGDSDNRSALRSAYGPVPRSSSYPIPGEDAARDFAMRRLGLLFELRHDTESRKEGA